MVYQELTSPENVGRPGGQVLSSCVWGRAGSGLRGRDPGEPPTLQAT